MTATELKSLLHDYLAVLLAALGTIRRDRRLILGRGNRLAVLPNGEATPDREGCQ